MNFHSRYVPDVVRSRLLQAVVGSQSDTFDGEVSAKRIVIRVARGKRLLPWQGTFRGAAFPDGDGTMITGKFDSNWGLVFLGYPFLFGVSSNIALSSLWGYGFETRGVSTIMFAVAIVSCLWIRYRYQRDVADITELLQQGCGD